jgi:predicted nucleic acid-binding protein
VSESGARREQGVIDTNVVIRLAALSTEHLPVKSLISAVTLAELCVGLLVARSDAEKVERLAHLQLAEADFEPLPFDSPAARAFGRVSASLRRRGRKSDARSLDAMIAASAMAQGLPLYTCNPRDFEGIDDLEVIPVPVRPLQ